MAEYGFHEDGTPMLGFLQSADQAISTELVLRQLTPYDRYLMQQPFLQDFIPRVGPVLDEHIKNFRHALDNWLDGERILRAEWRSDQSDSAPKRSEPQP